ncbi:hypothetical protein [Paraglaciecola sp.]|uniref:hypothetical protein n=1 Tax=Paraglaciecola sp. TaxID=1920173 RepID=UPI003EF286E8
MNIKYIEKQALKICLKLGYDDIQQDILNYLINLFRTYPELAAILAANPTLSIDEALEIIYKMEAFANKSAGIECTKAFLNAEKQDSLTLMALLVLYLLEMLAESERKKDMRIMAEKNSPFRLSQTPNPWINNSSDTKNKKKKKDRRDP